MNDLDMRTTEQRARRAQAHILEHPEPLIAACKRLAPELRTRLLACSEVAGDLAQWAATDLNAEAFVRFVLLLAIPAEPAPAEELLPALALTDDGQFWVSRMVPVARAKLLSRAMADTWVWFRKALPGLAAEVFPAWSETDTLLQAPLAAVTTFFAVHGDDAPAPGLADLPAHSVVGIEWNPRTPRATRADPSETFASAKDRQDSRQWADELAGRAGRQSVVLDGRPAGVGRRYGLTEERIRAEYDAARDHYPAPTVQDVAERLWVSESTLKRALKALGMYWPPRPA